MLPLFEDSPERASASSRAFANLDGLMALEQGTPSGRAADIVLETRNRGASAERSARTGGVDAGLNASAGPRSSANRLEVPALRFATAGTTGWMA